MAELLERLARVVGADHLTTDAARRDEISWDALSEGRFDPRHKPPTALPLCIAAPDSTAQVRDIVLIANETRTPLVPYGGGSGLMGGALSIRPGIALDLRRMNRVLAIEPDAMSARVEAGAVLESVDQKLNERGFVLGHDPWTLPVATIGGAISTNSVGYRAGKYGSMGEQVLGLEAVLGSGEIMRTRAVAKSSAGIDLNALLIGGEGCFGVVTEAAIRIFVRPEKSAVHACGFDTFERGYNAIREIFKRGVEPAVIDFGDNADKFDGALLYLAFEGAKEVVAAEEKIALSICA